MVLDILMARQPIFDTNLNVVAYELLYRDKENLTRSLIIDNNSATCQVLLNNYTSICQDGKINTLPAFINTTKEILISDQIPEISRKHIVLEILEGMEINDTLIQGIQRYYDAGYRMALDDFIYGPEYDPILEMVNIVKLDLLQMNDQELVRHTELLKPFQVTLLAEKVETLAQFERCKSLGFKLFQGYFLCKPQIIEGRKLNSSETVMLELLSLFTDPDVTSYDIEQVVKKDPQLTFKIIRIINSPLFNLIRNIESLEEAVILLGIGDLKRWCALIALSGEKQKPDELTRHILMRARMCELLAENNTNMTKQGGFMLGIFAGLDALLDTPRDQILNQVMLSEEIKRAILYGEGIYGELLTTVDNLMMCKWNELSPRYSERVLNEAYQSSIIWVRETLLRMA